jgi:hypothetical protein
MQQGNEAKMGDFARKSEGSEETGSRCVVRQVLSSQTSADDAQWQWWPRCKRLRSIKSGVPGILDLTGVNETLNQRIEALNEARFVREHEDLA